MSDGEEAAEDRRAEGKRARRTLGWLMAGGFGLFLLGWWMLPALIDGRYVWWWNVVQISSLFASLASTILFAAVCVYGFMLFALGPGGALSRILGATSIVVAAPFFVIAVISMAFGTMSSTAHMKSWAPISVVTLSTSASRIANCEARVEAHRWHVEKTTEAGTRTAREAPPQCEIGETRGRLCDDGTPVITYGDSYACDSPTGKRVATAPGVGPNPF